MNLDCFGFALLRPSIGLKSPRHHPKLSNAKLKLIPIWLLAFSGAGRMVFFSSHRLMMMSTFVLIGRCDWFGFGFGFGFGFDFGFGFGFATLS